MNDGAAGLIRSRLLSKLDGVRKQGGSWRARCPAHEDHVASLMIAPGRDQPVLIKCHAGCGTEDILKAIGVTWADLCAGGDDRPGGEWTPYGDAEAVYDYPDEHGDLLYQVVRAPGKRFLQRRPDPSARSGWAWNMDGVRRVLYRLPKLRPAIDAGRFIYLPEGEKDVHALEVAGQVATTSPGGAGKWRDEYAGTLRDAVVIIIADKDDPGWAHARQAAASLDGIAAAVEICEAAAGKDVSEHLAAGLTVGDLVRIWQQGDPPPDLAPDLLELVTAPDPPQVYALGDLLELMDRMLLTGVEGFGKTTLLRQMCLCAACGIHPFWFTPIQPRRVLWIDCENRERQNRREFRPLVAKAASVGAPLGEGMFRVIHRPQGVNLCSDEGAAWLSERLTAHEPELVAMGSLWHLAAEDLNKEENARQLVLAVNAAVDKAGCAVAIEAHAAKGDGKTRSWTPAGSRLFMSWPDVGLGLIPDRRTDPENPERFILKRWRGTRDRAQRWPSKLYPGAPGGWPWVAEPEQDKWS